ncbi:MAG: hypothetical protein O2962_02755 [Cyanobacteria bacterium]|nr:hypothetical protein [Cyanobacteriota bacterium]
MEINRVGTGGIDNGDAAKGPGKAQEPAVSAFNLEAQVIPSDIAAGQAGQARVSNNDSNEVDVEGVGRIQLNDQLKEAFEKNIIRALRNQEQVMINTVEVFGGSNPTLRGAVTSALLSI